MENNFETNITRTIINNKLEAEEKANSLQSQITVLGGRLTSLEEKSRTEKLESANLWAQIERLSKLLEELRTWQNETKKKPEKKTSILDIFRW